MFKNIRSSKKISISAVALLLGGIGQNISAHTTVIDSSMMEGQTAWTGFSIPHGCDGTPVRAQSFVLPSGANPVAIRTDTSAAVDLNAEMNTVPPAHSSDGTGGIPLAPRLIQSNEVFRTTSAAIDANNNLRGGRFDYGYLQTDLTGVVPFRFSAPTFLPASCAKSAILRVAVANYCNRSQTDPARADIWIGRLTPLFNDPALVSVGFWPTVTVHRDMTNNPMDASCGAGYDIEITPNDADIDSLLPIPGYWPL